MTYSLFVFIGLQPEKLRKKSIGRPKKGRKSVNFTVPSKGAQSSKAMGRLQFNQAKINHRDQDRALWMNQSVPTNGASAERVIIFRKI